jgi:F420-dependent oxidoreductase-like protein
MTTFGLQLPSFTLDVTDSALFDRVVEMAVAGEESGFTSLWVMDHLYQLPALGGEDQPMLEAYTLLGALAARTRSVQLGTLVTGVTYRNPAILAKQVTTLDIVSSGRAILGIGAAWHDTEHIAFGVDYPSDRERLDRLEEALKICRAMFTEDAPSFAGKHYSIERVRNLPRPIRPDGIPIMVGGGGEKRTLKLVAQYADQCNVAGDLETVRHKLDVLRGHCADAGRDLTEIRTTRLGSLFLTDSAPLKPTYRIRSLSKIQPLSCPTQRSSPGQELILENPKLKPSSRPCPRISTFYTSANPPHWTVAMYWL